MCAFHDTKINSCVSCVYGTYSLHEEVDGMSDVTNKKHNFPPNMTWDAQVAGNGIA
ncbi:uncharacterized protein PHALS_08431 [Plasmopara halstedii]|uniref:Uncharacterized protein n=1 Tax=Plasmopara halstedii TaxID=4781 RepID=A0A0P1ADG4_PLAHL|nr:uncharacterized protein PHALS_08431 [Plasmopara halstedii]CEG38351.1 hypothetical protein PHALS_08431 [Plasmopara halstedii]|eukprot:XP_024574720.1 hypothetical protein PHALS_08431 [Plasmopara halstedii]